MNKPIKDYSIIQKAYDLIKWFVPVLNKLPREHRFILGNRMVSGLYDFLESLIKARYAPSGAKLALLEPLNTDLEILRYQNRMLLDFGLVNMARYEYAAKALHDIGVELGGWIRSQKDKSGDKG